jgi:hypothetical protein
MFCSDREIQRRYRNDEKAMRYAAGKYAVEDDDHVANDILEERVRSARSGSSGPAAAVGSSAAVKTGTATRTASRPSSAARAGSKSTSTSRQPEAGTKSQESFGFQLCPFRIAYCLSEIKHNGAQR